MMLKTNHTNGYWLARAGTAGMLILGVLLMGCDKDLNQKNQNANAEQALEPSAITPAPSAPPSEFVPPPPQEKSDRDWSQPYQLIPLGHVVLKLPTKYILMSGYVPGASEADKERVILDASIDVSPEGIPRFLSNDEATQEKQKILEGTRKTPLDQNNSLMFEARAYEVDSKKGVSVSDEKSVLNQIAYSGDYLTPPELLPTIGLKAYRSKSGLEYLYFSLDAGFKKPSGDIFYLHCEKDIPSILPNTRMCRGGFAPTSGIGVSYSYPSKHLKYWKEIHQFISNSVQVQTN